MAEYIAHLGHMRDGVLSSYNSTRLQGRDDIDAKQQANEWAKRSIGLIGEATWLQVTLDGRSIFSEPWRKR